MRHSTEKTPSIPEKDPTIILKALGPTQLHVTDIKPVLETYGTVSSLQDLHQTPPCFKATFSDIHSAQKVIGLGKITIESTEFTLSLDSKEVEIAIDHYSEEDVDVLVVGHFQETVMQPSIDSKKVKEQIELMKAVTTRDQFDQELISMMAIRYDLIPILTPYLITKPIPFKPNDSFSYLPHNDEIFLRNLVGAGLLGDDALPKEVRPTKSKTKPPPEQNSPQNQGYQGWNAQANSIGSFLRRASRDLPKDGPSFLSLKQDQQSTKGNNSGSILKPAVAVGPANQALLEMARISELIENNSESNIKNYHTDIPAIFSTFPNTMLDVTDRRFDYNHISLVSYAALHNSDRSFKALMELGADPALSDCYSTHRWDALAFSAAANSRTIFNELLGKPTEKLELSLAGAVEAAAMMHHNEILAITIAFAQEYDQNLKKTRENTKRTGITKEKENENEKENKKENADESEEVDLFGDKNAIEKVLERGICAAVEWDNLEGISILLEAGANVNSRNYAGDTLLMVAYRSAHKAVFNKILSRNPDLGAKNEEEWTILHMAAAFGDASTVKTLLEHGADPEIPDAENKTPIILALEFNFANVVKVFYQSGIILPRNADLPSKISAFPLNCMPPYLKVPPPRYSTFLGNGRDTSQEISSLLSKSAQKQEIITSLFQKVMQKNVQNLSKIIEEAQKPKPDEEQNDPNQNQSRSQKQNHSFNQNLHQYLNYQKEQAMNHGVVANVPSQVRCAGQKEGKFGTSWMTKTPRVSEPVKVETNGIRLVYEILKQPFSNL